MITTLSSVRMPRHHFELQDCVRYARKIGDKIIVVTQENSGFAVHRVTQAVTWEAEDQVLLMNYFPFAESGRERAFEYATSQVLVLKSVTHSTEPPATT